MTVLGETETRRAEILKTIIPGCLEYLREMHETFEDIRTDPTTEEFIKRECVRIRDYLVHAVGEAQQLRDSNVYTPWGKLEYVDIKEDKMHKEFILIGIMCADALKAIRHASTRGKASLDAMLIASNVLGAVLSLEP